MKVAEGIGPLDSVLAVRMRDALKVGPLIIIVLASSLLLVLESGTLLGISKESTDRASGRDCKSALSLNGITRNISKRASCGKYCAQSQFWSV